MNSALRFGLTIFAGVFAASLAFPPAQAQSLLPFAAGPRAAQGLDNIQFPVPTGEPKAYREAATAKCLGGNCVFRFTKVGLKRLLRIDNVSCVVIVDAASPFRFLFLAKSPNGNPSNIVAVIPAQAIDSPGGVILVSNQAGPYYFGGGERPFMVTPASGGADNVCTLSGALFPVPAP